MIDIYDNYACGCPVSVPVSGTLTTACEQGAPCPGREQTEAGRGPSCTPTEDQPYCGACDRCLDRAASDEVRRYLTSGRVPSCAMCDASIPEGQTHRCAEPPLTCVHGRAWSLCPECASGRSSSPECCAYEPDPESDDRERMECERAGQTGHQSCGTWPCGCPRFIACPASAPARTQP